MSDSVTKTIDQLSEFTSTMTKDTVVDLSAVRTTCQKCGLYQLCLPMGLETGELDRLDQIIKRRRTVARGEALYRQGEPFSSVYAIRSGSIKSYTNMEDGQEQVTGFHLPGELLGLDAIDTEYHTTSTVALETASLCEIPFARLEELGQQIPGLQHHLLRLMSRELHHDHCQLTLIAKMPAEARLASFLLSLSHHFRNRGFSPTEFNLSMSRNDIGNLLGLAVETVSRLFTHFQEEGLLTVDRKHIELHNIDGLLALTHQCGANVIMRQHTPQSSQKA